MKLFLCFLVGFCYSSIIYAEDVSAVLRIKYKTNSHLVDPSQEYIVDNLYSLVDNFSKSRIYIIGHTDDRGTAEYNLILSERRSQEIYDLVIKRGAIADKVDVYAMGETAPVADNKLSTGRRTNRRVVVTFTNLDKAMSGQLKEMIAKTDGIDLIEVKSEKEKKYIAEKEKEVENTYLDKKNIEPEIITKESSRTKKNKFYLEVNSLHNELRIEDQNSSNDFDELLSEVKTSVNINYLREIHESLFLDLNLNLRIYGYAKELDFNISQDQEKTIVNFGVGLQHLTRSWLRNELLLRYYNQLYLNNTEPPGTINWSLEFAKVLRLDWKPVFILLNNKYFDIELSPILSAFSKSLSGNEVSSGYAVGGDFTSYFLWKKRIGVGARYQRSYFGSEQNTTWDITHENLELGFKFRFDF